MTATLRSTWRGRSSPGCACASRAAARSRSTPTRTPRPCAAAAPATRSVTTGRGRAVDRESRVGKLGRTFFTTLLDENAASHVAFGDGYAEPVGDPADLARINRSREHIDFMIGGDEVEVTGTTRAGERVPILRNGAWQI